MYRHCNVRPNASSEICQLDCSLIFPVILSWDTVQVFVQERLAYRSQFLIGLSVINSEKLRNSFNQEWLSELKRRCVALLNINYKILVYRSFVLQQEILISFMK